MSATTRPSREAQAGGVGPCATRLRSGRPGNGARSGPSQQAVVTHALSKTPPLSATSPGQTLKPHLSPLAAWPDSGGGWWCARTGSDTMPASTPLCAGAWRVRLQTARRTAVSAAAQSHPQPARPSTPKPALATSSFTPKPAANPNSVSSSSPRPYTTSPSLPKPHSSGGAGLPGVPPAQQVLPPHGAGLNCCALYHTRACYASSNRVSDAGTALCGHTHHGGFESAWRRRGAARARRTRCLVSPAGGAGHTLVGPPC